LRRHANAAVGVAAKTLCDRMASQRHARSSRGNLVTDRNAPGDAKAQRAFEELFARDFRGARTEPADTLFAGGIVAPSTQCGSSITIFWSVGTPHMFSDNCEIMKSIAVRPTSSICTLIPLNGM
jgi:hypothetical protein